MVIGGSTTSLLSILNLIDYKQYQIDLLLKRNAGELFHNIPAGVNVLPAALPNIVKLKFRKALSLRCIYNYFHSKLGRGAFSPIQLLQIAEIDYARVSNKLSKHYDVAISFLEFWPLYYTANFVKATRKIAWIHVDYIEAGFNPQLDIASMQKFEKIVVVANSCADSLAKTFPHLKDRILCIENILSTHAIREMSHEPVDFKMTDNAINISTVCRIVFEHKGLDRAVEAFNKLRQEGLCDDVNWYIIGDGPDYQELEHLIKIYGLDTHIFLLGSQKNPHKYIKDSDLFFLPSRYEGKPMAVTEAMMLGIPAMVAEYASAQEQIENGVDGIILPNNDVSIYEGLKRVLMNRAIITSLKNNVKQRDYSNLAEFSKVISLIDNTINADYKKHRIYEGIQCEK